MNLEALLQKYIAEVKGGQRDSSIRSVRTVSSLSSTDQRAWVQIRRELQDIGISPSQFDGNRELIISTLKQAFDLLPSTTITLQPSKKATQIG